MEPFNPFLDINDSDQTIIRPSPGGRRSHSSALPSRRTAFAGLSQTLYDTAGFKSDNPLLSSAFSLLSLVPRLRNLPFHEAVNELQQGLIDEIRNFEQRAFQKGISPPEVDMGKYMLCSLLDETVLNTPWGNQSGWGNNSLSSLFYKKLVGGEEFFQIVDQLKQQPSQNQNLLELAYMCLSLGFEGKYRYVNSGLTSLERQRQELYLLMQHLKGEPELTLSTHWQGIRDIRNPLIRHIPLWVLAGVTGVLLMVIYMVYTYSIRDTSDQLYKNLFAIGQQIPDGAVVSSVPPLQLVKLPSPPPRQFKQVLASEIDQHKVTLTDSGGLRVFNMFSSGTADIKPDDQEMLEKIVQVLQEKNAGVLIIGHTDNQRLNFSARFKSNWHLSVARAESMAEAMGQYGLPKERIQYEGRADNDPIAPNDTPANRAMNRRIDIVIR